MAKVVIDTNVVVSALISSAGNPAKILNMVFNEDIQIYYSQEILDEYREVLSRKHFNFRPEIQTGILDAIEEAGFMVNPAVSSIPLPDERDRIFYDATVESNALLITGNARHFPDKAFIVTPTHFISMIDAENGNAVSSGC